MLQSTHAVIEMRDDCRANVGGRANAGGSLLGNLRSSLDIGGNPPPTRSRRVKSVRSGVRVAGAEFAEADQLAVGLVP